MASHSDFTPSSRGRAQRKSPFEGSRQRGVPLRRASFVDTSKESYLKSSSSLSENDGYTSKVTLDFEQKVRLRSLQKPRRIDHYNQRTKEESKQTNNPDWTSVQQTWESSTMDMDFKSFQHMEKSLEVAENNLEHLKSMEEITQHLMTQAKLEEGRTADIINTKFAHLTASLNSRKRKLEAELVMNTDYYVTDVHGVQVSIKEKKSILDGAIKIARELKSASNLKSCHSLNQILCKLNMTIEEEILKLDNLKKREFPCFYMDWDEITHVLENMGAVSCDVPNVHHLGSNPLKVTNIGKEFNNSAVTQVDVKCQAFVDDTCAVPSLQKSDMCPEGSYTGFQERALLSIQKCGNAFPETASSPDVIIEEIIEDDQENCPEGAHRKMSFPKKLTPFGPKAESPELVVVSYVLNPCHFYVRKVSQKKTAVRLEKILKQFCSYKSSSPSDVLELGTKIFVESKQHRTWCRAEIIELLPLQNTNEGKPCGPTKYKICDIAMMKVFLTDFGHPEALVVSRVPDEVAVNIEQVTLEYTVIEDLCLVVRKPDLFTDAQLNDINKLALQCSLKDIVPRHSTEGWEKRARTEFLRMVNNKAVLMKVFREEGGVLIVDLMKPAASKISSDMPVSLRDALVFLDLARFRYELSDRCENTEPLQYCLPMIPQENSSFPVVVSYINNPGDFYIQEVERGPEFAAFLSKIVEVYKCEDEVGLEILCPIQGQACVAKFDDGVWYRAQVVGLPGHQEVEVKYVDFGNTAKIKMNEMRKIKDEFLALPAKAIKCKLAHIAPCKGSDEWSRKSKDRFEELTEDKSVFCVVNEKSQDNVLVVELYDSMNVYPEVSCSVNSILVKEDLASYIEGIKVSTKSHNEIWDPSFEEICKTKKTRLTCGNQDLSQFADVELVCNKELQVRINHVISPSRIFVHFMSLEPILESLQERMTDTYLKSKSETITWTVDMHCAAYIEDLNQWQRGQISRIVSENSVEVFLIDLGAIKNVESKDLRELKHDLKTPKPLAVECSLTDIRPAGGTEHWTATACDALRNHLTGNVVTLIIQEINSSPLPVKIRNKDERMCADISEYMIKKGLALRGERRLKADASTPSSSIPCEMPFEQNNTDANNLLAEAESPAMSFEPEKGTNFLPETESPAMSSEPEKGTNSSVSKEEDAEGSMAQPMVVETYKPPAIPSVNHFSAIISCISDNGTIYVTPQSEEIKLTKLMSDIQSNFKSLGLLEPYSWKVGEACVVRAADTLWYRGEVREIGHGIIRVQYVDYGYIERIPQCHLYPTVLYADIPPFAIPCHLYKVVPIGGVWQQDAVELLRELLTKRIVEIHIMEHSESLSGKVCIKLHFDGMSLSHFMAYHKHCINEDADDSMPKLEITNGDEEQLEENCEISYEDLMLPELDTPPLPLYTAPVLPVLGELVPVKVTHVILPNEVFISLVQSGSVNKHNNEENRGFFENVDEALSHYNQNIESIPFLTDFRKDMPCLAKYSDELWYRAKLLNISEFQPLSILVQFVDYGSTETLPTSRLRQLPSQLMQYPAQAFKVLLAGFKSALCDPEAERIPYSPNWNIEALWAALDCFKGKNLSASSVTHTPEHTVFLYEDGHLFHMKLVEMGFAELI
ncbi:RING finger protein 17 isoform X2 [Sceloporus undulatus]|uniref:RING finger protein 17 isoform X2 n=1 Tax=Sceloporus undulatus TaxID=8520 RepID=UPI001C4C2026|nr:RING finger protein 17 isoform X2 [Sceloporus undulatus]